MSRAENHNHSSTCCLCLSDDESTFHSNSIMKSLPLHEMVKFCIGIQIGVEKRADQLVSTSICNECVCNINSFYTFKKRVLDAQELINSLPQSNENECDLPQTNDQHNNDSGDEFFEDHEEYAFVLEDGDAEYEIDQIENDENNDDQFRDDVQMDTASDQESTVQPVVRATLSASAKKRPPSPSEKHSPSIPSKASHKKTKLSTQAQTERFTLQMNECLICPAVLRDILELKEHIETHGHIKCKACNRQFVRYSNLKRHFNSVHSKPKPFICDICGLGFNFSVNLQSHASLHYSCKLQNET